jgi:hypothetical protein
VHGRVLGGRTLHDIPSWQGSWKEAEKERFLNMVRTACSLHVHAGHQPGALRKTDDGSHLSSQ